MRRTRTTALGKQTAPGTAFLAILTGLIASLGCAGTVGMNGGGGTDDGEAIGSGVTASINHEQPLASPCRINLRGRYAHSVVINVPGYRPFRARFKPTTAGWLWEGVNFWDQVNIAVARLTGEVYMLDNEEYLHAFAASAPRPLPNHMHVVAVMEPDPAWHKIGALR